MFKILPATFAAGVFLYLFEITLKNLHYQNRHGNRSDEHTGKAVKTYRATILPNTKLIVSNALAAYKTGRLSYIEIQQTLKDTLETELKYLEKQITFQQRHITLIHHYSGRKAPNE